MEIVFWLLVLVLFHSYFLYPVIIRILSLFFNQNKKNLEKQYTVSILISAYNEEKVIRERIQNIAALDYDFTKIELLIGSDNSSDKTNEILFEMKNTISWLSVHSFEERRGKVSVLNDLAKKAKNEILLFTDANTVFNKDILKNLIRNFDDPDIGGASGRLKLIEGKTNLLTKTEEKKYWEYETFIKRYEGKCGILIGANGGIFCIRRELFKSIPVDKPVTDDLFISLSVLQQKYKFVYEFNALAIEESAQGLRNEYNRKTRFGATNLHTLLSFKDLIFNKNILMSYSLWSHKIIRWFTPVILILIILINMMLFSEGNLYKIVLFIQIFILLFGGLGIILKKFNLYITPLVMIFYFLMTNVALLVGLFKFLFNKQTAFWQSTPR